MSKNTIYRFKDEMTLARALNHNMNWTIRQLQELVRISKRQNNALLSFGIGLGLTAVMLWELSKENRLLAEEVGKLQVANGNLVDEVDKVEARIEALEEGRTQM